MFISLPAIIIIGLFILIGYLDKNGYLLKKELQPYCQRALLMLQPYKSCKFVKSMMVSIKNDLSYCAKTYKIYKQKNEKPQNDYGVVQYVYDLVKFSNNYDIMQYWCYLCIEHYIPTNSFAYNEEPIYKALKNEISNKVKEVINKNNCPKSFLYQFDKIKIN